MNASMLSYILFSCLLLSVQAEYCGVREIIRYTQRLLDDSSVSCPCRQTATSSCSCLPIPERGHELACFVDGTKHLMEDNAPSNPKLANGDQCQYETKGNVKEFLEKILTTYQEIDKFNA
ncbi:uncharacterized protein LOC120498628 [Passer montanus]|uniref:uncharacterized protein LOC120498628 n=1 Tax=Passer montanus TaxID=9160 RepID=UPI00195F4A2B|nr:uncharacterized protein LOC120498628 [Passer montanus]